MTFKKSRDTYFLTFCFKKLFYTREIKETLSRFSNYIYSSKIFHKTIFLQLDNFAFCNGSQTALCKRDEIGELAEIALEVKSRRGKPPKKFVDAVKKRKQKMPCIRRNNNSKCPKRFAFDDVEGGDEMVAAAKVSQQDTAMMKKLPFMQSLMPYLSPMQCMGER